jgi:hypothetical protein
MPDPIALRVARRHQAAVVLRDVPTTETRLEHSNAGTISAVELMKILEPTAWFLVKLRFRPSLSGLPNTISWEARDDNANIVTGTLVLHAAVGERGRELGRGRGRAGTVNRSTVAYMIKGALSAHDWRADFESPGHKKVHTINRKPRHKYKCAKCNQVRFLPFDERPDPPGCPTK